MLSSMIFQHRKMVLLNSITFHDWGHPVLKNIMSEIVVDKVVSNINYITLHNFHNSNFRCYQVNAAVFINKNVRLSLTIVFVIVNISDRNSNINAGWSTRCLQHNLWRLVEWHFYRPDALLNAKQTNNCN